MYIYIYICTHICVFVCVCVYVCMYMYMYIYIYIYIYIYTENEITPNSQKYDFMKIISEIFNHIQTDGQTFL